MQTFRCQCGARVFFENVRCLACASELGFSPEVGALGTITRIGENDYALAGVTYRKCANFVEQGVCNWMVPAESTEQFCLACRLNNVVPDLSAPENRQKWAEVESAKRRLIYSLHRLGLPLVPKTEDPEGRLAFDIKADTAEARVHTGHADGLITLNLSEADAVAREKTRVELKERYRTLLGHFRHEIGHYYWERLVKEGGELAAFRSLFGDERTDYGAALNEHYAAERRDFAEAFISSYAAAHPWEDFAETFAHYLHMHDTLETARAFCFAAADETPPGELAGLDLELGQWMELTIALNALNRSMGLPDAYPFAISHTVRQKLEFVDRLIRKARAPVASAGRSVASAA